MLMSGAYGNTVLRCPIASRKFTACLFKPCLIVPWYPHWRIRSDVPKTPGIYFPPQLFDIGFMTLFQIFSHGNGVSPFFPAISSSLADTRNPISCSLITGIQVSPLHHIRPAPAALICRQKRLRTHPLLKPPLFHADQAPSLRFPAWYHTEPLLCLYDILSGIPQKTAQLTGFYFPYGYLLPAVFQKSSNT